MTKGKSVNHHFTQSSVPREGPSVCKAKAEPSLYSCYFNTRELVIRNIFLICNISAVPLKILTLN